MLNTVLGGFKPKSFVQNELMLNLNPVVFSDLQPGDGALRWVEADLPNRGALGQADAQAQQEADLPVAEVGERFDRAPVPRARGRHPRKHRLHRHRRLQAQAHPRPHLVSNGPYP